MLLLVENPLGMVLKLQASTKKAVNFCNLRLDKCSSFLGSVRNISPQLWQFEHLTALYLNDNILSRLPTDIGLLVCLRTLDLSSNKLRSLPAELGELIQLRSVFNSFWNILKINDNF